MMQSIALTESNMVHDDEYVIVQADDMDLDDDSSYDDCDEDLKVRLSPLPSVYSEGNSSKGYIPNDLEALIEDSVTASIVSLEDVENSKEEADDGGVAAMEMEVVEDDENEGSKDHSEATPSSCIKATDETEFKSTTPTEPISKDDKPMEQPKLLAPGGHNRLSNKKRRKKVKMLKKAAAAAAATAALAEMNKASIPPTSPIRNVQKTRNSSSTKIKKQQSHGNNLAVACATESLESYRHDHNLKKKAAPNYVSLL
mmetsp:Transcript_37197/g.111362  ORF Transcript_37197/g.111362 Transcript_37197/m.111362 type:complete len:256 (-) Transcript_37197:291-1058(-)